MTSRRAEGDPTSKRDGRLVAEKHLELGGRLVQRILIYRGIVVTAPLHEVVVSLRVREQLERLVCRRRGRRQAACRADQAAVLIRVRLTSEHKYRHLQP